MAEAARGRILVVEDDWDLQFVIAETFRDEGYEVVEAATQEEAEEKLEEQAFFAVTLDGNVPAGAPGDGQETSTVGLAGWIRERFPSLLIVCLPAGEKRLGELLAAAEGGPTTGLTKPFRTEQLLKVVQA